MAILMQMLDSVPHSKMVHNLLLLLFSLWALLLSPLPLSESLPSTAMERIVYMERTPGSPQMRKSKHVHILASVIGSEEAATKALIYCYKNVLDGFSAILTDPQVDTLSNQPGVLKILPAPISNHPEQLEVSSP